MYTKILLHKEIKVYCVCVSITTAAAVLSICSSLIYEKNVKTLYLIIRCLVDVIVVIVVGHIIDYRW